MKQKLAILYILTCLALSLPAQTLKTPEQFLGYALGEKFTPHHKIVRYFEQAAEASPRRMKLENYGFTSEGRPLLLAIVASEENFAKLDEIRKNNLRLTGLLKDSPGNTNGPAIVWLSYNVHGNESSSSEVSMQTLYELLNAENTQTKSWLKNTVVIIDPCINPDGRDRYVNWYNQVLGKRSNPNADAREHVEPWPNGRSNHYNFDLNRDWAWQTQAESKQRMLKYHEWMPQIHVDFHEQSPYSPYYFAPGAEPLHDIITSWQRNFQTTMGKNHAKYFDAKGWLYFTKEYFDLFYPSYGDTYPLFNGSIGMTYEQAGSGRAGLRIALDAIDTLKLSDRIAHHFTTSMSTLEIASANAPALLNEFKKYFDASNNGSFDTYKTYIIQATDENKMDAIKTLFEKNKIEWGYASKGTAIRAYNYYSSKEENYMPGQNDVVVSAAQPKSALIKVLFEPVSRLSDSATYDITAWALPYVYGLQAYATKEKVIGRKPSPVVIQNSFEANAYGYLVNYNSLSDGKLLAGLLARNVKVRFAEKDFVYAGTKYNRGSLVVLGKGNETKIQQFLDLATQLKNKVTVVRSGFMESGFDFGSDKLRNIKKPNVALVTGKEASENAAGEIWFFFDQELDYPITLINSEDLQFANLKETNVLIIPHGYYKMLTDKEAVAELKTWVRQGGNLIVLENAAAALAEMDAGLKLKKADEAKKEDSPKGDVYANLKKYENRERDFLSSNVPGAIYKVELDVSHPLAFGYPANYYTLKMNGNIFEFGKESWNVGVIKKEKQVAGFVGSDVKNKLVDGTVIGVTPLGRGNIIYFADNPLFRSFWENGKLLFTNAVFLVGQ
jgi:hypothetical protein